MNYEGIPIIIIVCYIFGEIYKTIFKNNKNLFKLIPMLVSILGGVLGVIIYFTVPKIIFNVDNLWTALCIGIVSGVSSTGTNQIIKQLFLKEQVKEDA